MPVIRWMLSLSFESLSHQTRESPLAVQPDNWTRSGDHLRDVVSVDEGAAFGGFRHAGQHVEQRRLSGSVVTEDGRDLTLVHVQIQTCIARWPHTKK